LTIGSMARMRPGRSSHAAAAPAEVRDLRLLVRLAADAVADQARTTPKPAARPPTGSRADVAEPLAGPRLAMPASSASPRHLEQPPRCRIDLADRVRHAPRRRTSRRASRPRPR
jgi:hypothetical protein